MFNPNKKTNILAGVLFSALVLLVVTPIIASGAGAANYTPLAPIGDTVAGPANATTLATYLTGIYKVGVALAAVLAVLMIVWGGFTYLSTDAIGNKNEGKEYISNALLGLVLAIGSYVIVYTISPNLVDIGLSFQPVGSALDQGSYQRDQSLFYRAERVANNNTVDRIAAQGRSCEGMVGSARENCLAIWQGSSSGTSKAIAAATLLDSRGTNPTAQAEANQVQAQMNQAYQNAIDELNQRNDDSAEASRLENQRSIQNWYLDNLRSSGPLGANASVYNLDDLIAQKAQITNHTGELYEELSQTGDGTSQALLLQQSKLLEDRVALKIKSICLRYPGSPKCTNI